MMTAVMKPFFLRLPAALFSLLCLLSMWGCKDSSVMPGIVASVNGQAISFREIESRRINRFSGRSPEAKAWSEAELQAQYRYIVNQIIEELVICQYMKSKKFVLEAGQLDTEEKLIRDDYPEKAFEQMLSEEGINLEEWREVLHRHLMVRKFLLQVLRPEISITPEEVQQYFTEHSADFLVPEQWHFIQITGPDKKTVEKARNSIIVSKNASEVQKEFLVSIHDIHMGIDRLPGDLRAELALLGLWKSSPVKAVDDGFRVLVLIEKMPAVMLEAAEIAKRVEQALAEEKMRAQYTAWMKKRIAGADIRLAPLLLVEKLPAAESASDTSLSRNASSGGSRREQHSLPDFYDAAAREPLPTQSP